MARKNRAKGSNVGGSPNKKVPKKQMPSLERDAAVLRAMTPAERVQEIERQRRRDARANRKARAAKAKKLRIDMQKKRRVIEAMASGSAKRAKGARNKFFGTMTPVTPDD